MTTAGKLRLVVETARATADKAEQQQPADAPLLLHLRVVEFQAAALGKLHEQPTDPGRRAAVYAAVAGFLKGRRGKKMT